jgi:hypothetical protein
MTVEPEADIDPRPRYDEEVRLVAGILERVDRTARPSPPLLLTWGLLGAAVDFAYFTYYRIFYSGGHPPAILLQLSLPALGLGLAITCATIIAVRRERRTLVDRAIAITFSVAGVCAALPLLLSFPRWVMAGPDYSIIWNLLAACAAASLGLQYRAKPLVLGGLALAATVVIARFDMYNIDVILAIGMLAGLAAPGVYYAMRGVRR